MAVGEAAVAAPRLDFVIGGARSGKTRLALARAESSGLAPVMLATATAGDAEMAERIARHRAERGAAWTTVEETLDLAGALGRNTRADRIVVVDCLTLWLSNVFFSGPGHAVAEAGFVEAAIDALAAAFAVLSGPVIAVSNEIGLGIVPETALVRRFRDHQGRLNQRVAAEAERTTLMVAGLPLVIRG